MLAFESGKQRITAGDGFALNSQRNIQADQLLAEPIPGAANPENESELNGAASPWGAAALPEGRW
jgi:hypothetical protein